MQDNEKRAYPMRGLPAYGKSHMAAAGRRSRVVLDTDQYFTPVGDASSQQLVAHKTYNKGPFVGTSVTNFGYIRTWYAFRQLTHLSELTSKSRQSIGRWS